MKKPLIACAVLAAAGAASAQSSVTVFGVIDSALTIGRGEVSDRTRIQSGGLSSSRIGFRGTEDLGGGLSAGFWLEAGFSSDTGMGAATNSNNQVSGASNGGLNFNRRSTVSLSGNWGELRLGRDYTPQYRTLSAFDPFGTNGAGSSLVEEYDFRDDIITATRASNTIGYFLPGTLGGLYGQVQYYLGENSKPAVNEKDGTGAGLRLGYAKGPINVSAGTSSTSYVAGDHKTRNVGGSYDFGAAKLSTVYNVDKIGNDKLKGYLIGLNMPWGAAEIRASYAMVNVRAAGAAGDAKTKKWAVGYVYNLSKRTAVYTTFARVSNNANADFALNGARTGRGQGSSGFDLGIRHNF